MDRSDTVAKIDLHEATREQLVEAAGLRPLVAEAVLKARDERGGEIADLGALRDALGGVKGIGPATLDQLGDVLKVGRRAAKPADEKPADEKPAEAARAAAKAGADETRRTGEEAGRATGQAAEATAQVAEAGAEEAADAVASGAKVASRAAEEVVGAGASAAEAGAEEERRAVERTAEVVSTITRHGAETAERATERTAEFALTVVRGGVEAAERATGGLVEAERAAVARSGEAVTGLSRLVADLVNEQVRANVEALRALGRARTWPEVLEAHAAFFRGNLERMSEGSGRYLEAVTRMAAGLAGGGRGSDKTAA